MQGPIPGFRLLLVVVLALALIVADARFDRLTVVRSTLATGLTPVYWLGNAPTQFSDWAASLFVNKDDLKRDNDELQARLLILERRALKYAALASENNELRRLMNSSEVLDDRVIVSEVVSVSPDPFSHELVINKGRSDGVHEGQAILDAGGLMGQVIQVSQITARVLLVSDSSHAVPVEVVRNGLRAILLGTGKANSLELVHVPDTANIREGDLLVSSGLGGRFPRGYPVAEVSRISKEPGEPFITIEATPTATLNQSRMLLVVFQALVPDNQRAENQLEPAKGSTSVVDRLQKER
ncbi:MULTISPECIES: rod shape-determining protein MreC [unclassified Marinobacter]|uniref:rod shape-determining protein MreC n=1 Tax=unclassified Marinobacter TaxID=83889 RepID=UPI000BF6314D|nr:MULTISPECIES: rod shape-determining protein MreC [unclassified Marinobacter]PFG09514.1 rod shape-determining protein MreC [Marinobacter sp. LV10MA510-1]PFG51420.1 rod shape-determining protein MreC [Marinobacter sp. LV10R520-4]